MGFIQSIKDKFNGKKDNGVDTSDPRHNPYEEHLLYTIPITIEGEEVPIEIREIKNVKAEVMGAQAVFKYRNEKVPVIISSPHADNFSIGINISMHKANMDDFKKELKRLQEEGLASPAAKLSYNPDTRNAILFRRSDAKIGGSIQRWRDVCEGQLQTLVDDFLACMPFVMRIYGE